MTDDRLHQLRARLWPTRRLYEARNTEVMREIAALRESIDRLAARQEHMFVWQAELRTRVRRAQGLAARAYEALQGWPAELAAARTHPDYDLAYTEPEPLISVLLPTYQSPDTLVDRALASVLGQTYRNWEAIVVGDHCTDDTEQRVAAIGDPRIRFHNLAARENDPADPFERLAIKGSAPHAAGVDMSHGRWIARLDDDDAWHPDHLETLLSAREDRAEFIYSRMRMVDAAAPDQPPLRSCGAWPPQLGEFGCQASMFHGLLRFLKLDRVSALNSEPNDWNLARRAWEAGVRFRFVDQETVTLYVHPRWAQLVAEYEALGLPLEAVGYP